MSYHSYTNHGIDTSKIYTDLVNPTKVDTQLCAFKVAVFSIGVDSEFHQLGWCCYLSLWHLHSKTYEPSLPLG